MHQLSAHDYGQRENEEVGRVGFASAAWVGQHGVVQAGGGADEDRELEAAQCLGSPDAQYEAWRKDPAAVHVSWRTYFDALDKSGPGRAVCLFFSLFFFLLL